MPTASGNAESWRVQMMEMPGFAARLHFALSIGKGSPSLKNVGSIWALPKWGGGSRPLPEWFGALNFEKNCPCSKGHLLGLGGLNPCQDGLGHLCSEN